MYHLDLSKLSFSTSVPIVAGIGIELTAYAPLLAALLVVAISRERRGIRRLVSPVVRWRFGIRWYIAALVGFPIVFLLADVIRAAVRAPLPVAWVSVPAPATIAFLIGALIAGSFGEEVGWRGFGQRRLQLRHNALTAAVVVGVVWGLWHLWPVVAPGGLDGTTWSDASLTIVRLIAMSVVFAWMFNSTQGSLLAVMLAHAGYNLGIRLVPSVTGDHADPFAIALLVLAAVLIGVVYGARRLSRRANT